MVVTSYLQVLGWSSKKGSFLWRTSIFAAKSLPFEFVHGKKNYSETKKMSRTKKNTITRHFHSDVCPWGNCYSRRKKTKNFRSGSIKIGAPPKEGSKGPRDGMDTSPRSTPRSSPRGSSLRCKYVRVWKEKVRIENPWCLRNPWKKKTILPETKDSTWKWMVGRWFSHWEGLFSGAMLVLL